MTAILVSFALLLGGVSVASYIILKQQSDDALLVNLAGRQRMLTQKMTKEATEMVAFTQANNLQQVAGQREKLQATVRVFDMTLFALKDGGNAPLNLETTKMRTTRAATPAVGKQLAAVTSLWEPFKKNLTLLVDSNGTDSAAAQVVRDSNMELMSQMSLAVDQMQAESETKVNVLFLVQWTALGMGVLLVAFGAWLARATIAQPLVRLAAAAHAMSTGNLNVDLRLEGTRELQDLGASFDRMRASLVASLGAMEGASADDDV
jgi:methyl-accepting chemotaxis protein